MNSASAAALISHMADCIEQGFEREMRSPTGSEKTEMQLSVLYPAVDRLSMLSCQHSCCRSIHPIRMIDRQPV